MLDNTRECSAVARDPATPLIASAPTKPIRYWFEMGDQDLFYPNPTIPDGMHDWTLSAALMAKVLAAKGYTASSYSRATLSSLTDRPPHRRCRRRWNGCGRAIRFRRTGRLKKRRHHVTAATAVNYSELPPCRSLWARD
jgi:hypothetical protein